MPNNSIIYIYISLNGLRYFTVALQSFPTFETFPNFPVNVDENASVNIILLMYQHFSKCLTFFIHGHISTIIDSQEPNFKVQEPEDILVG